MYIKEEKIKRAKKKEKDSYYIATNKNQFKYLKYLN